MSTPRRSLPSVLGLVTALLVASLGLVSAPADARPARTRISASVPKTATAGQPVAVTGRIRPRSPGRDVQVQILVGSTWRLLERTRTAADSTYALAVSLPVGQQSVRVVARAKRAKLGSTRAKRVAVAPAPPSPDRGSRLAAGATLSAGQYLRSPSGRYQLVMQTDGNLVLYDRTAGAALWSIGSQGSGRRLVVQADGDVVVVGDSGIAFQTTTAGFDASELLVQDDGNLVVYSHGAATWARSSGYVGATLLTGATLPAGAVRRSADRRYTLAMQADGNLVLYDGGTALWSTQTTGANLLIMQTDGNLVLYPVAGGPAVWSTQTTGSGATLETQTDGNLVVYQGGAARWSWRTGTIS